MAKQLLLHGGITESELLKLFVGRLRTEVGVALLANSGSYVINSCAPA